MSSVEQNYDIHDKELLVVVNALEQQRQYAESYLELTIYTNYKNLLSFTTIKALNRRQVRQLELLGQYKFKILYTLGKDNRRVDALSRRLDYIVTKDISQELILKQKEDGSLTPVKQLATVMQIFRKDTDSKIRKAYAGDLIVVELRRDQPNTSVLKFRGKIYLPQECIKEVIKEYYNNLLQGYLGITKTLEIIGRTYTRPKIRTEVENYIRRYVLYQRNKVARHKKYRQIQFTPITDTP